MTYDKMAIVVALIGARIGSAELVEIAREYNDARRNLWDFPSMAAREAMVDAGVEVKDAYEENRR